MNGGPFPDFGAANVLVVGDVMLDRYWSGATSRISPEAPVPVVRVNSTEERPGGAANVALNIAALGGQAAVLGITGHDQAADSLQKQLEASGVRCIFHRQTGGRTITKLRILSQTQLLIRLDFEDGFEQIHSQVIALELRSHITDAGAVVFSDYAKGTLRPARDLIEIAQSHGKPVFVDPKSCDFEMYRGATLVSPNLEEFEAVVGHCRHEDELVEKGYGLLRAHDLEALLVTRGAWGMTLLREDQPELHLPAQGREVFDVTGAGDTVIGVLAAAVAVGLDLADATALANAAAGIVVGKLGAATVSDWELRRTLQTNHKPRGKATP